MNTEKLLNAINELDGDLIEGYFKTDAELQSVKVRKRKNAWLKWSAAACLCLAVAIAVVTPSLMGRSGQLPISRYSGNVSIQYTHKAKFDKPTENMMPYYTEDELFQMADCIFSGKIEKIQNIEIDFDGERVYKSLITILPDRFYKGDSKQASITVLAAPIDRYREVTDEDLLSTLKEGEYGVFLANAVAVGTVLSDNNCSFDASEICDARFIDSTRFAFIRSEDAVTRYCDTISPTDSPVFSSLKETDWDSVVEYVGDFCAVNFVKQDRFYQVGGVSISAYGTVEYLKHENDAITILLDKKTSDPIYATLFGYRKKPDSEQNEIYGAAISTDERKSGVTYLETGFVVYVNGVQVNELLQAPGEYEIIIDYRGLKSACEWTDWGIYIHGFDSLLITPLEAMFEEGFDFSKLQPSEDLPS